MQSKFQGISNVSGLPVTNHPHAHRRSVKFQQRGGAYVLPPLPYSSLTDFLRDVVITWLARDEQADAVLSEKFHCGIIERVTGAQTSKPKGGKNCLLMCLVMNCLC